MLNDILKSKLDILAQDSVILDALKMLFNNRIEEERPKVSPDDDNTVIGEKYRAYEEARGIIDKVFIDLQAYNTQKSDNKTFNKSR